MIAMSYPGLRYCLIQRSEPHWVVSHSWHSWRDLRKSMLAILASPSTNLLGKSDIARTSARMTSCLALTLVCRWRACLVVVVCEGEGGQARLIFWALPALAGKFERGMSPSQVKASVFPPGPCRPFSSKIPAACPNLLHAFQLIRWFRAATHPLPEPHG